MEININREIENIFSNLYKFKDININREIIIYGAGNLGKLSVTILKNIGIKPKYILDINEKIKGTYIEDIEVISPNELEIDDRTNCLTLISIVKIPFNNIKKYLEGLGYKNIFQFYDVANLVEQSGINNGWIFDDISEDSKRKIIDVYNGLDDIESKKLYLQWLYWRICRNEIKFEGIDINTENKFFINKVESILGDDETFIDIGSHIGETINTFIEKVDGKFNQIIGFEPDTKAYKELIGALDCKFKKYKNKIKVHNCGVGESKTVGYISNHLEMANNIKLSETLYYKSKVDIITLDSLDTIEPSFIKIHAEGMEYDILKGSINTLIKHRPIIVITTYHSEDGVYKIPKLLMKNLNRYKFYFRLHGYCGTQSVIYCIPEERMEK